MTTEAQSILHKSLDDVSGLQKRQRVLFVALFFILLICAFWLGRVSESHPVDIQTLVVAAMFFVLVSMVYVATAFAALQLRLTKKILKAIGFASKT